MNYHYVYGGWDPGVYGPVEYVSTPPAAARGVCRCPDSGKDSVRSRSGSARCRRCHLDLYPGPTAHVSRRPSRPKLPMGGSPSSSQGGREAADRRQRRPSPAGPKDPYDYIRRTRLKADEWDTYWESSGPPSSQPRTETKNSPSPSPGKANPHAAKRSERKSAGYPVPAEQTLKSPLSALSCGEEKGPEPVSPAVPTSGKGSDVDAAGTEVTSGTGGGEPGDGKQAETDGGKEADTADEPPGFADLVSMKSRLTAAEIRYRKYQRRKPLRKVALQLEDVIIEENEDDLAADSADEIYTSLPTIQDESEPSPGSSDDELGLGKFRVDSTNFAEEILSELYGCTGSVAGQTAGGGREQTLSPRSLAEEIMEELYGRTEEGRVEQEEQEVAVLSSEPQEDQKSSQGRNLVSSLRYLRLRVGIGEYMISEYIYNSH